MGIERLTGREKKMIKEMNSKPLSKFFDICSLILKGAVIFLIALPIVTPLALKRPDFLIPSVKLVFMNDRFYMVVIISLAFMMHISQRRKLLIIINKLENTDHVTENIQKEQ